MKTKRKPSVESRIRTIQKKADKILLEIAAKRDKLRTLLDELNDVEVSCDCAVESIHEACQSLCYAADEISRYV